MANNFIDVVNMAQVIGTNFSPDTVYPLRSQPIFDALAQERNWSENRAPRQGDTIVFPVLAGLSANTASLDTTAATITASQKGTYTRRTVTIGAYGDHGVIDMLQTPVTTFVDTFVDHVQLLTDQAMDSQDVLARAAMDANAYAGETQSTYSGTYHYYASNATNTSGMGPLKARDVREVVTDMKNANVPRYPDGYYRCVLSPIQAEQLRSETGMAAWRDPHSYSDPADIYSGEIGVFEGCRFIESPRVKAVSTSEYFAYFMGRDFVGKANGRPLRVSTKSTLDGTHENLLTIYWDVLVGYKIIRRASGRIVSCSTTRPS